MTSEPTSFEHLTADERVARHGQLLDKARACTNVGETGDDRDLLTVFDEVLAFLDESLPPFACQQGCTHCCSLSPLVSSLEWQAILAHLHTVPQAVRQQIIYQAGQLRGMAWIFDTARKQLLSKTGDKKTITADAECPFLVRQQCAIYPVRPLQCRGYGQSMVRHEGQQKFFGSLIALRWIRDHFDKQVDPKAVILPLYNEYQDVLNRLNEAAKGDSAFLAQWVWSNVENGDFVTTPRPYKPFPTSTPSADGPAT